MARKLGAPVAPRPACQAVQQAVNHTIQNGTYRKWLDRWGLGSEAVETSEINPPGLPKTS